MKKILKIISIVLFLFNCNINDNENDSTGNYKSREIENFVDIHDSQLHKIIEDLKLNEYSTNELKAQAILSYINNNFEYQEDGGDGDIYDFAKFPSETIIDGGGDCEDTAILFVSLARIAGFDVKFLKIPGHMMAVVQGNFIGYYTEYDNKKYFVVETARTNRTIGEIYIKSEEVLSNKKNYIIENNELISVIIKK